MQNQFAFDAASGSLQGSLLLAFASCASEGRPPARRRAQSASRFAPVALGILAIACVTVLLWTNNLIHSAARDVKSARGAGTFDAFRPLAVRAVRDFAPLANEPRMMILDAMTTVAAMTPFEARPQVLEAIAWGKREAAVAIAAEPKNWRLHFAAAQFHAEAARFERALTTDARHHFDKTRELAPGSGGVLARLPRPARPDAPAIVGRNPGRHYVIWQRLPGALFYQLQQKRDIEAWSLTHSGPGRVVSRSASGTGAAYRVRACTADQNCGPWSLVARARVRRPPETGAPRRARRRTP